MIEQLIQSTDNNNIMTTKQQRNDNNIELSLPLVICSCNPAQYYYEKETTTGLIGTEKVKQLYCGCICEMRSAAIITNFLCLVVPLQVGTDIYYNYQTSLLPLLVFVILTIASFSGIYGVLHYNIRCMAISIICCLFMELCVLYEINVGSIGENLVVIFIGLLIIYPNIMFLMEVLTDSENTKRN
jgi:hypothetical protein